MKTSEIKNLLRYSIGKVQETATISTNTIGFCVGWNGEKWEAYPGPICPLGAVLLVRQPKPSEKNIIENQYYVCVSNIYDYRFFPESLASETLKEVLGVSTEYLRDVMNGMENLPCPNKDNQGWEIGNYIYKRLNGQA